MAEICAYCGHEEKSWRSILCYRCDDCESFVHYDCIKSKQPSPLLGDVFYNFKCQSCGEEEKEEFHRANLSWKNALMLVLYNLHKNGQGRCGFFHWKAHICAFIDKYWLILFGHQRKKTGLWGGTVAGALSAGCPEVFESGVAVVDQGYWRLVSVEPPLMAFESEKKFPKTYRKRQKEFSPADYLLTERSCRRAKANALSAAIELKEKRESLVKSQKKETKSRKSQNKKKGKVETSINDRQLQEVEDSTSNSSSSLQERDFFMKECEAPSVVAQTHQELFETIPSETVLSSSSSKIANEQTDLKGQSSKLTYESLGLSLGEGEDIDDDDLDIDIDIESVVVNTDDMIDIHSSSLEIKTLIQPEEIKWEQASLPEMESLPDETESEGESERDIKEEIEENVESDEDDNNDGDETDSTDDGSEGQRNYEMVELAGESKEDKEIDDGSVVNKRKKQGRPRKRRRIDDPPPESCPERLQRISVFEENELLDRLNMSDQNHTLTPELALLRRKLICNRTNREYGLPVFDLDAQVEKAVKNHRPDGATETNQSLSPLLPKLPTKTAQSRETRDLDRFMMKDCGKRKETREYTSFRQRLVGLEDHELRPMISPYTTRVLVPFIWRNKNMSRQPLKMRLLQEIQAYGNRHNPSWTPPQPPSIDYCYVRPEHIASVNALAREFFWPGIDMSECLQYPDFSCVVLYRKIVIAFAFMVPDRGYNEAYISFIFTHPEWRGVGIASFMLYHLIQTCMGKDVLLHVSASNPAMLLYQKFGFKAEELSLNFYHKYFPSNCTDSCHAFLMRLSR